MRTLAQRSTETNYKSSRDSINTTFGMIRHYIGRLGHHFRAADILVSCAPRLVNLLHDFEVRNVPLLIKCSAADDPYIASSKPACFCCLLYFRHHPGHVVEPVSHNKIYLNWRSPEFSTPVGRIGPNHQGDILNAMNQEIRKEALRQIDHKSASHAWHPDSMTGITQSVRCGQRWESVKTAKSVDESIVSFQGCDTSPVVEATDASSIEANTGDEDDIHTQHVASSVHTTKDSSQTWETFHEEYVSDSDVGGGIQI